MKMAALFVQFINASLPIFYTTRIQVLSSLLADFGNSHTCSFRISQSYTAEDKHFLIFHWYFHHRIFDRIKWSMLSCWILDTSFIISIKCICHSKKVFISYICNRVMLKYKIAAKRKTAKMKWALWCITTHLKWPTDIKTSINRLVFDAEQMAIMNLKMINIYVKINVKPF